MALQEIGDLYNYDAEQGHMACKILGVMHYDIRTLTYVLTEVDAEEESRCRYYVSGMSGDKMLLKR